MCDQGNGGTHNPKKVLLSCYRVLRRPLLWGNLIICIYWVIQLNCRMLMSFDMKTMVTTMKMFMKLGGLRQF